MHRKFFVWIAVLVNLQVAVSQDSTTWKRYPVISPDGSTIAFSFQGDIYRVPASGGHALALTQHEAYDFHPVWSHDSKQLAFASDREGNFDVFVMPASGGRALALTTHSFSDVPVAFDGKNERVWFESAMMPDRQTADFPERFFRQLHSVPVTGGRSRLDLGSNLQESQPNVSGSKILFQDIKGYEDPWRKHHTSSVARDLWMYNAADGSYAQLTTDPAEDRNPVWGPGENDIFFLSERSGTFNVWKMNASQPSQVTQLTFYTDHPVRFLSVANDGTLCFGYRGDIFTLKQGSPAQKIAIALTPDDQFDRSTFRTFSKDMQDMDVSPTGKEIAFVIRGEVYVTAVESGMTRRITNTPEQERSVTFRPDGRAIAYAGERNGSWNIYETSLKQEDEPYFYLATDLAEKSLVVNASETFQPSYSPDGKEIAFLENRTTLRVLNFASGQTRTVMPGNLNYSYSDGDQYYQWSPDGKWFLVTYLAGSRWVEEVGLVKADGTEPVKNITKSGYQDGNPRWSLKGNAMIWFSDREGFRSHGSWGSEGDVYAMFFNQESWDKFRLSPEEYEILKLQEGDKEKKKEEPKPAVVDKKGKAKSTEETKPAADSTKKPWILKPKLEEAVVFDWEGMEDRTQRLTIHSSLLSDAVLSPDGDKLYYLTRFEKGNDLWVTDIRKDETKILAKLDAQGGGIQLDKEGKKLFVMNRSQMMVIDVASGEKKPIAFKAEMQWNPNEERAYIFDHMWRQVREKFYDPEIRNLDWEGVGKEYSRFLPSINNNYDFAELVSELLGELNGSHTGCRYRYTNPNGNQTASFAAFYDEKYTGDGLKIAEVIDKSPLILANSGIKAGHIIEQIDGVAIKAGDDYFPLLNRKAGERIRIALYDPATSKRWTAVVKPITFGEENELLYERWVKSRRALVDSLSGGRLAYVHVRGMDSESFREVYSEVLGRYVDREALIVDTRSNGGGWLHDDLATFLSGKTYVTLEPRGQKVGAEPENKWQKPSVVLMGEDNYSDAHFFPYTYKALGIGKLIGMPVPGTATAVWWEPQIDPTLVFGIPQVGVKGLDGRYLENQQLEPDIKVKNEYKPALQGRDQQIEAAVKELLK